MNKNMPLETLQLHNILPAFIVSEKPINSKDGIKTGMRSDLNFIVLLADGITSPASLNALSKWLQKYVFLKSIHMGRTMMF